MKKKLICMTLFVSTLAVFSLAIAAPDIAAPDMDVSADPSASCRVSSQGSVELATGTCDCSKCKAGQSCCPTANGYCGCFPMPCP